MTPIHTPDLQVDISSGDNKAFIEGKTSVNFKAIVALILQKKVTALFKDWGDKPVIVDSELLTSLASAPADSMENKTQLIMVTLGTGILAGVFFLAVLQLALTFFDVTIGRQGLMYIAGSLLGLGILVNVMARIKKRNRAEKIVETMEKVTTLLTKK